MRRPQITQKCAPIRQINCNFGRLPAEQLIQSGPESVRMLKRNIVSRTGKNFHASSTDFPGNSDLKMTWRIGKRWAAGSERIDDSIRTHWKRAKLRRSGTLKLPKEMRWRIQLFRAKTCESAETRVAVLIKWIQASRRASRPSSWGFSRSRKNLITCHWFKKSNAQGLIDTWHSIHPCSQKFRSQTKNSVDCADEL